eukprot:g5053.t1
MMRTLLPRLNKYSLRHFGTSALPGTSTAEAGLGNQFKGRKRFYDHVTVHPYFSPEYPSASASAPSHYEVHLDGRKVRTGRGIPLKVPSESLAFAVAGEWARQKDTLEPETMPLFALCSISSQLNASSRALSEEHVLGYLHTDTVTMRCPKEEGIALHLKQKEVLDPVVEWFTKEFDAPLEICDGLFAPELSPKTVEVVKDTLGDLNDWELAALESVTRTCKSLVLGLSVLRRRLGAEEAIEASRLEESHQIESWGLLENGHDFDINFARLRIFAASSFLWMIEPSERNYLAFELKRSARAVDDSGRKGPGEGKQGSLSSDVEKLFL